MQKDAFVLSHLGLGDNIMLIGAIRHLATLYKNVYVVCKKQNEENMNILYEDDPNIILYKVDNDINISPKYGCPISNFKTLTNNKCVFLSGGHCMTKLPCSYELLPFNFYIDMNIEPIHFWNSFKINYPPKSKELYTTLQDISYIFIHNTCSTGTVFKIEEIEDKLNLNKNNILVINPCENIYEKNHAFYSIANYFINHKLPYYIDIIINASTIILTDSSFWCLSMNLPIKTKHCYVYSRDHVKYDHIYEKQYQFPNNKSIFKNIKF